MRSCLLIALLFAAAEFVPAETPPKFDLQSARTSVSSESWDPSLPQPAATRQVLHDSAFIFSGTVLKVEHLSANLKCALPMTRISLRVENAIRGARSGQVIEVREWAGLWNAGERYRVGEHVLLFLYPASKLGLTSPVGGTAGRFRVDHDGTVEIGTNPGLRTFGGRQGARVRVKDLAAAIRREETE